MVKRPRLAALSLLAATGLAGSALAADQVIEPVAVPVMKSVFGQVEARNTVPARARIGGTIVDIAVEEGDEVKADEVVARVVDDKLALQMDALEGRLKATIAQRDNAATSLRRLQDLFAQGATPKSRLDDAQTQYDVLVNQIQALESEKAVIAQQEREGAIVAPVDGRVLSVPVTPGSVILPGETVARIAGGGYFLRLSLPERHAAGIREGDTVRVSRRQITENGAAADIEGRLAKVYPEIVNGRVTADVEVGGLGDFFVGERTLVSIPIGMREVIAVPVSAVTTRHGIDYVTLRADGTETAVSVIPGERFPGDPPRVEILTGLRPGDTVIVP